jgi:hypothetical protein
MPGTRPRAAESTRGTWDGTRDAESLPRKFWEIGEPDALKGARPVRGGAEGKGLAGDTTYTVHRQVYGVHGTSPAAYSTLFVRIALTGHYSIFDQLSATRQFPAQVPPQAIEEKSRICYAPAVLYL